MQTNQSTRVLITGGGAPGAAGIIKCLRALNTCFILAVDINPEAHGKYLADAFEVIPKPDTQEFADSILAMCVRYKINCIIPLVTKELEVFSELKNEFAKKGIHILISDPQALAIANHKGRLYQTLSKAGISVPDFRIVHNWFEMHKAIQDLGYPQNEVIIKPCQSNGLRGFRIVKAEVDEAALLLHHKPDNSYIQLKQLESIFSHHPMPPYLVTEYLPGEEYTVDVLMHKGEALQIVPRKRIAMTHGISTKGKIENIPEIIAYVKEICALVPMEWMIGVQVKRARDGSFKLLEINPRVQGTTVACLGAGINFPALAVTLALEGTFQYTEPKWGVQFSRYWEEVYF
jgi:carbamoyl-phosphate synthase large subunit